MQKRTFRDPESGKLPRNIYTTDEQNETIKMAAKELKMSIGNAMAFLSQNFLDELDSGLE